MFIPLTREELKEIAARLGATPDGDKRALQTWVEAIRQKLADAGEPRATAPKDTAVPLTPLTREELKEIAARLGATPDGDKRALQTWIDAIKWKLSNVNGTAEPQSGKADGSDGAAALRSQTECTRLNAAPTADAIYAAESPHEDAADLTEMRTPARPQPRAGITEEAASEARTELFLSSPASLPRPEPEPGMPVLRMLTWNVRKFACVEDDAEHAKRISVLSAELADAKPALLFVQEVSSGPNGKRAIEKLTTQLNQESKCADADYRWRVTDAAGDNEAYGIIWDATSALGAAAPELWLWVRAKTSPPPFGLCPADSRELRAVHAYAAASIAQELDGFRRAPLFARFPGYADGAPIFCTVHLVSGADASNSRSQVRAEALLLQAALGLGAEGGRALVLCGDFNEDDAPFHQWHPDHELAGFHEAPAACRAARDLFFGAFLRAVDATKPTNLYPITEAPAHNDDIWVSRRHFDTSSIDTAVGTISRVSALLQTHGKELLLGRGHKRNLTFQFCAKYFSDHVPIAVTLIYQSPEAPIAGRNAGLASRAAREAAPAAEIAGTRPGAAGASKLNAAATAVEAEAASVHRNRPRGRAPKGKEWDYAKGEWTDVATAS